MKITRMKSATGDLAQMPMGELSRQRAAIAAKLEQREAEWLKLGETLEAEAA